MPNPRQFLKSFSLTQGMNIRDFILVDIDIGHEVIKRYQVYRYPLTMTFTSASDRANQYKLLQELRNRLSRGRIVNSSYGNPYWCTISNIKFAESTGDTVVITADGFGERVY